jgi:ABC-type multidrug transport system permease subunit
MRFLFATAWKDLRRRYRDPMALLAWVLLPALVTTLVSLVFGGGDAKPRGHLLFLDQDETVVSGLIPGFFSRGQLSDMVVVDKVADLPSARARLDAGRASALLIVPSGFGRAVLRNQPTTLQLIVNPSQRILPGIIRESLTILSEGAFYASQLLGDQFPQFTGKAPSDETVAATSILVNHALRRAAGYINPLVIQVDEHVVEDRTVTPTSIGGLFFAGMLFLSVMLISQGLGADLWRERAFGTLRRVAMTPCSMAAFLGGKLLSSAVLLACIASLGLLLAHWLLNVSISHFGLALGWVVFSGVAMNLLITLLEIQASNERSANMFTTFVVFILGMVGGAFFPFDMMPAWLAAIGRWTPNGWAVSEFRFILDGRIETASLGTAFIGLLAVSAGAFLLVTRGLRTRFLQ